jgi:aspartyl-tRNA(Asn)/glutamyl-tRNA(Gln) amidotransferase subunit C
MTISKTKLQTLANLTYLELESHESEELTHEISSILDFVQQLKTINTTGIAPLLHPMNLSQRLRLDKADESSCLAELAEIAPVFEEELYLVPKVMDDRD